MADLFISYASEDRDYVKLLVSEFERQGWTVWWDHHIEAGTSFDRGIEDALESSYCVVVVWSKSSLQSDWVRAEAAEGLERNILVPILLDNVKPPLLFRQKQAVSLVDWKKASGHDPGQLQRLMPSITAILENYKESRIPVSTQRAWVLGKVTSEDGDEELANALQFALSLGLSYLENLFLYEANFNETRVNEMDPNQLQELVDDEGLDGYLFGELTRSDEGSELCVSAKLSGHPAAVASRVLIERGEETLQVASLIVQMAEQLQGHETGNAEAIQTYLDRISIESLTLYTQSVALTQQNEYEKVKEYCHQSLVVSPDFWPAYRALAVACVYLGQENEARQAMSKAIQSIGLESAKMQHFARGVYHSIYSQDYDKAALEFSAMLKLSPIDISAINNLAVCRYYQLKFSDARELAARDLQLYPDKLLSRQNAAFYAMYANDFEDADELAAEVLAKSRAFVSSVVIKALIRAGHGQKESAKEIYEAFLGESDAHDAVLLQGLADLALAHDEATDATQLLERGIVLDDTANNHEHQARKLLMLAETADSDLVGTLIERSIGVSMSTANLLALAAHCAESGTEPPDKAVREGRRKTSAQGRACARMLEAMVAFSQGDIGATVTSLDRALDELDMWLVHYSMVLVCHRMDMPLEVGDHTRICLERFGEGLCATMDEQPSYRYLSRVQSMV